MDTVTGLTLIWRLFIVMLFLSCFFLLTVEPQYLYNLHFQTAKGLGKRVETT